MRLLLLRCMSPFMAQNRHVAAAAECPVLKEKRTLGHSPFQVRF
jgi:hypothetical protein